MNKGTDFVNVVITGDGNYLIPIGVLMTSILENTETPERFRFFVFTTDFSTDQWGKIETIARKYCCQTIQVPMKEYEYLFEKIDVSKFALDYVNIVVYHRLLILKVLPDDVRKSFYVDGDMIVETDLAELYDEFPINKLAAVVVEPLAMQNYEKTLSHLNLIDDFRPFRTERYQAPYFNAGFFLLNIELSKQYKLFEKAFDFLARYPNPPYADQDTLNAVIGQAYRKELVYLNPEFNVFCNIHYESKYDRAYYSEDLIRKSFQHPRVFHYAGSNKPWINRECLNHYDKWWEYCRKSIFSSLVEPPKPPKLRYSFLLFGFLPCVKFSYYKKKHKLRERIALFGLFPILQLDSVYGEIVSRKFLWLIKI